MANDTLRAALESANEKFKGTPYPFGMSGMTMSGYMSSRRGTMFTSNLSQFKNPLYPHFAKCFTNFENLAGKYSSGYRQMKDDAEVVAKIYKFDPKEVPEAYNNFFLILYYPKKKKYTLEIRRSVRKLTENFGFRYNTAFIDALQVGDKLQKDDILYRSTSYDEFMNYGYGRNVTTMHTMDPFVAEDALIISETLSKEFSSIGVITPETSVNDNDILLNLHGDSEHYKPFPDIGEEATNNIILAKKRIHNNRILHDIKPYELRQVSFINNKILYGSGRVIDIDIYCNKEMKDFEPSPFNEQFLKYLSMQQEFYQELFAVTEAIIQNEDVTYDNNISYWYKRAKDYLDPEFKFREANGNAFSHYKIKFTLEKVTYISDGQKLVGRYGNKGVVSRVLPDDEMPILSNGKRVDALLNSLSPTNRLISAPLYELSINFIGNRTCEYLSTLTDRKEQEEFLFDILYRINEVQCNKMKIFYDQKDDIEKTIWMKEIIDHGIHFEVPYLWETTILYDRIRSCYDAYPLVFQPYKVFIRKHGRMHRMMGKYTGYVGEMYLLNLKYTSQKDFSTRSMAFINSRELPSKSDSAKKHQDLYPKTPVKIGYQEILNLLSMVRPRVLAEITMLYRSSILGRRKLGEKLLRSKKKLKNIPKMDQFISRNVEIFNAKFKAMGLKLDFHGNAMYVTAYDKKIHTFQTDYGTVFIGTRNEYMDYLIREKIERKYEEDVAVVDSVKGYETMVEEEVAALRKEVDGLF